MKYQRIGFSKYNKLLGTAEKQCEKGHFYESQCN